MKESQSARPGLAGLRETGLGRGRTIRFSFDGDPVQAYEGESVAAALLAAGHRQLRMSPRGGQPRGAFCWMGLCQECTVVIDGVRRPACRVESRDGLVILPGTVE